MEEHKTPQKQDGVKINPEFAKGIGIGVLIVLSIGFLFQLGGVSFGSSSGGSGKVLKTTSGNSAAPTAPSPSDPSAAAPAGDVKIADITTDDYIYGDVNAPVTIVEYSDTECPFCKRFHPTLKEVVDNSDGNVNWVYRHFPLTSIHPKAPKEAEAVECAGEQGGNDGFWAYLNRLFEVTPANNGLDPAQLLTIADDVGLDSGKLQECMDSGKYAAKVKAQADDAVSAGGRGTPYSVVVGPNGEVIPLSGAVPIAQIEATVDSLLN